MKNLLILFFTLLIAASSLSAKNRDIFDRKEQKENNLITNQGSTDQTWDVLGTFNTLEGGWQGVTTDGNYIYTTKWSGMGEFQKYDMDGNFIEAFEITGAAGIKDFAYDGEYFYGSNGEYDTPTVHKLDFENQTLVESFAVQFPPGDGVRHLSYDPNTDTFWGGSWSTLHNFTRSGDIINSIDGVSFAYGSAFDNWSEGGPYVWVFDQLGNRGNLTQVSLQTMSLTGVSYDVIANTSGTTASACAGGLESSELYAPGYFSLLANIQEIPNIIVAYELCPTAVDDAPAAPSNLMVTPGEMGSLSAELEWNNPSTTVAGTPLSDLSEVKVYRDDIEIYSVENPTTGAFQSFTDNSAENGFNFYAVRGYNSYGGGLISSRNIWVGDDIPDCVNNIDLAQTSTGELSATLIWENPSAGLHGGYLASIDGYKIIRSDGEEFTISGETTSFIDETIPEVGNYGYLVTPFNSVGDGPTTESPVVLISDGSLLIAEEFYNFPPSGWSIEGGENWNQSPGNSAGGTAPEAIFNWNPQTIGDQYLITKPIDVTDIDEVDFQFKHKLSHYGEGYELKVVYSTDMINWIDLWTLVPETNIGPELLEFTIPTNSETLYIGWLFSGDSYQINSWYIDDVIVSIPNPYIAPTNLTADVNEEGLVTLNWNSPESNNSNRGNTSVDHYNVYRFDELLGETSTTTFTDQLPDFGTYTYTVVAVYAEGESDPISVNLDYEPSGGNIFWLGYGIEFTGGALGANGTIAYDIALDFDLGENLITKVRKIRAAGGDGYTNPWKIVEFDGTLSNDAAIISGLEGTIETLGRDETNVFIKSEIDLNIDCTISEPFAIVLSVPERSDQSDSNHFSGEVDINIAEHSWIQCVDGGIDWVTLNNLSGNEYVWNLSALVEINNSSDIAEILPGTTTLSQNYPNPFNPATTINFFNNMSGKVELNIYNAKGELVSKLINEDKFRAGNHSIKFDGSNLNSGVYFYTLKTPTKTISKKMVLVK